MKEYMKPQVDIVDIETQDMIALSIYPDEYASQDEECLGRIGLTEDSWGEDE